VRSGGLADWRTVNEAVIAWTDSHYRSVAGDALGSIPNLDATARDAVADAVNRWQRGELNAGPGPMGLPRLIAELQTVDAFGVDRAARIAVTETTRIFAESERTAAQANPNLEYLVWQTAHDEATCLICAPMEGQRIPKGQATFPGGYYPPAHPNCRCGVTAVTEAAAEAMSGAGGDAVASKGKFDAFPPKVQETIANAERKLSSLTDHEELYVIDAKTGEILGHATGDAENVGLSSADRDKQIGSIITHNHPYDVSFSPGDIQNFTKYKLAEMRAVSSEHIYTLRADWTVVDPSEFRKIHDRMRVAVYDINLDKVLSGELAREVAKARWMHETMLRVLQETEGVKYERLINLY
jgi:SPP1 gp7 family putative phage head morphogenesis protein